MWIVSAAITGWRAKPSRSVTDFADNDDDVIANRGAGLLRPP